MVIMTQFYAGEASADEIQYQEESYLFGKAINSSEYDNIASGKQT